MSEDYEPPRLEISGVVPCALIAYWPTMNPVHVPLDGWEYTDQQPESPSRYSWEVDE